MPNQCRAQNGGLSSPARSTTAPALRRAIRCRCGAAARPGVIRSPVPPGGTLPAVTDWAAWHAPYGDPNSPLAQRVQEVRRQVSGGLDRASAGRVRY